MLKNKVTLLTGAASGIDSAGPGTQSDAAESGADNHDIAGGAIADRRRTAVGPS